MDRKPAEVCHPGEHLRDEMEARQIGSFSLFEATGVHWKRISVILDGNGDISEFCALAFAKYFGTSPDYWMNLQWAWDATKCATREEQVMGTTREEIKAWLENAKKQGATHMLVVCDTFDHEDYQVHVMPGESVEKAIEKYKNMSMSKVMEVYNLSMPIETQMAEFRAWNI